MKKIVFFAAVLAVLGLTACEKTLDVGEDNASTGQVKNSVLQVRTRGASGDGATVAYPVAVYVFEGDECKASQTIGDEGQTLNIALTEGTYSVYAVGGVSSSDYVLPSVSDALTSSAIALQEGKVLTDLMTASATVTLVDGGTNTVTLGMARKTMLIQDVTIKKVPSAATAVTVTIAPLWQSLTIGGTYSTTNGSSTIALTRQEDGRTWRNSGSAYLLPPSSQPASVSVNITMGGTTKTYTYSTSDELEAGYKINIDGTYTEAVGVNLTGTITGATWLGERTISFTFDEDGSSTSGNDNNGGDNDGDTQDFPLVGDTYQGCYVLAVTVEDDGLLAELVLLSPNERAVTSASDAESALASLGVDGISDWTVPTKAQMDAFAAARNDVTPAPAAGIYLYKNNNGVYYQYNLATGATGSANYITGINLRPVAIVSITKDKTAMKKYMFIALTLLVAACEKPILDEDVVLMNEANVILHMTQYEQEAFGNSGNRATTRTATDITELCSRLNIAIFDDDGTKVKTVAQKEGDASFGTVALTLAAGTYQLVVIAHNGEGSATITSTEKVTFPNNKVTDTFYYYGDLVVTSEVQSYDLTLTRAVAMFRMVLTDDEIPSSVAKFKFYYTGGSSTFSPSAGYGCVNSKQTEIRTVADGVTTFDIFTLPHTEEDVLTKLTVTALDANDNIIKEKVFENVPVSRNQVTRYTGSFFGSGGSGQTSDGTFRLTADPDWDSVNGYTF